jgi:hypothetical protein
MRLTWPTCPGRANHRLGVGVVQGWPGEGGAHGGAAEGPGNRRGGHHGEVRAHRHPVRTCHVGMPADHAGGVEDAGSGRRRA